MIDWHTELVLVNERIDEIEGRISLQSAKAQRLSNNKEDYKKAISILALLQERLKNAEQHKRFIESRTSKQAVREDVDGSAKVVKEPNQTQNMAAAHNIAGTPLKQVKIQNITIDIK